MDSTDTKALLEQIRTIITQGDAADASLIVELAASLDSASRKAQARLSECAGLIARGLRSEAIHIADTPPSLFEVIGDLSESDVEAFRQLLTKRGIVQPSTINGEQLRQLEEHYTVANELEPLLRTYRKLNLRKAPTTERLAVVRKLVAADPANPAWVEDLKALEVARIREIATAIQYPASLSEEVLLGMKNDLENKALSQRPDPGIIQRVAAAHDAARKTRFLKEIARLTPLAITDFSAMDLDALSDSLGAINELVSVEGFALPEEAELRLLDARRWHDKEHHAREQARAFDADCEAMRQLLEKRHRSSDIKSLLSRIESYGLEPPSLLLQQAHNSAHVAEAQEHRKRMAVIVAAAASVIAIGAGVVWTLAVVRDRGARRDFIAQSRALLEANTPAAASTLMDQARTAHAPWFSDPQVIKLSDEIQSAIDAEAARVARVNKLLAELSTLNAESPNLNEKIALAPDLIRTEEEQRQLAELQSRWDQEHADLKSKADERLNAMLPSIQALRDSLDQARESSSIRQAADPLTAALATARAIPHLSSESRDSLGALDKFLQAKLGDAAAMEKRVSEAETQNIRHRAALNEARAALPDVKAYAEAIKDAATRFPDAASIQDATRFIEAAPAYIDTLEATQFVAQLAKGVTQLPFDADNIQQKAAAASVASAGLASKRSPFALVAQRIEDQQSLIAACLESNDYKEAVGAVDTAEYVAVKLLTLSDPKRGRLTYYLPANSTPEKRQEHTEIEVYIDKGGDAATRKKLFNGATIIVQPALAPHCVMSQKLATLFRQQVESPWVSLVPQMLEVIADAKDANVQARARMLALLTKTQHKSGTLSPLSDDSRARIDKVDQMQQVAYFLACPSDTPGLDEDLRQRDRILQPVFAEIIADQRRKRVSDSMDHYRVGVLGLFRPLDVTAVVESAKANQKSVVLLKPGQRLREFWAVRETSEGVSFVVVAVMDATGKVKTLPLLETLPSGSPLFSPTDGASTPELLDAMLKKAGIAQRIVPPPAPWPTNTWTLSAE